MHIQLFVSFYLWVVLHELFVSMSGFVCFNVGLPAARRAAEITESPHLNTIHHHANPGVCVDIHI